jgi:hypothetical protein
LFNIDRKEKRKKKKRKKKKRKKEKKKKEKRKKEKKKKEKRKYFLHVKHDIKIGIVYIISASF